MKPRDVKLLDILYVNQLFKVKFVIAVSLHCIQLFSEGINKKSLSMVIFFALKFHISFDWGGGGIFSLELFVISELKLFQSKSCSSTLILFSR